MRAFFVNGADDADDACDDEVGIINGTGRASPRRIDLSCGFDAVGFTNLLNMTDHTQRDIIQADRGLIV